jgi:hypothetical protein
MEDRLERDIRREEEELHRDQLLGALLRSVGQETAPCEAPDDYETRHPLDG